jgi:general secretion pathway protein I
MKAGFTLLEVLVAIVILAGGAMILAVSWSGNANRLQRARLNNTLSLLLQREMVELEAKYKDKLGDVPESDGGEFEDYPGYQWDLAAKPFEMPDMSSALISREGGADDMLITMVRTIADYIKQAVKEVTVTISFKPKNAPKPITATATTYYVDYTKEPTLGGIPGGK